SQPESLASIKADSDETIRRLLYRLQSFLKDSLSKVAADIRKKIQSLGDRTDRLEHKIEELASAHNSNADAQKALEAWVES
ncbi:Hypothetical predicted protein, partial [Pelobates cultripes]